MIKKKNFLLTFLFFTLNAVAQTPRPLDEREQLPGVVENSYFGVGLGDVHTSFSNEALQNNLNATSFKNNAFGHNVFLGHYFKPYLAAELSLVNTTMNKSERLQATNISGDNKNHSFYFSILGLSLRPTWSITQRFQVYGLAGFAMLVRSGFVINNTTGISNENMATFLTGGGIAYALTSHWHINAGVEYTTPRNSQQQPGVTYAYAGFYYLFQKLHLAKTYTESYIFHKNLIQLAGFSTNIWNPAINQWVKAIHLKSGLSLMYERNIFHTHKYFSFDLGTNIATYRSTANNTSVEALSVFPAFRLWFFHSRLADFYLKLIVAGPTYISQSQVDGINLGSHFIFEDQFSLGTLLGKNKNFSIAAGITHYSNGGLFPENPGIQVPLMVSIGYAF